MLEVPGEEDAGDGGQTGEQDEGKTDAVSSEMIIDSQRGNPGNICYGLQFCARLALEDACQRKYEPERGAQQSNAAGGARFVSGKDHQQPHAEEGDVDGPGQHESK